MKDYNTIYEECRTQLKRIGIETQDDIKLVVNSRAKSRWGMCIMRGHDITIEVSSRLLDDNVPDISLKNVMIHELLHSITPGMHHGYSWKVLAEMVNRLYPEYNIKRSASAEEYGIKEESNKEWVAECKSCGNQIHRQRFSKVIANPSRYRCRCGGKLELIKIPDGQAVWSCHNVRQKDA